MESIIINKITLERIKPKCPPLKSLEFIPNHAVADLRCKLKEQASEGGKKSYFFKVFLVLLPSMQIVKDTYLE